MTDSSSLVHPRNNLLVTEPVARESGRRQPRFLASLEKPAPRRPLIHEERKWRLPDILEGTDRTCPGLIVSRWRGTDQSEHSFEITGNYHILAMALQPCTLSLRLGTKLIPRLDFTAGAIQITPPGLAAHLTHFGPYDILHFHIPNLLLAECFEWSHGKLPADGIALRDPLLAQDGLAQDGLLRELGATLLSLDSSDDPNGGLLANFLSLAVVTHLLGQYGDIASAVARKIPALPKWRLKRAVEFIETHLDSPVALADVAGAVGLSRMHFAAQFRAATGERPHEYVLRRRINKAQIALATTDVPIAELALALGFSSQAHFTVVFKQFSGLPPGRWRQIQRL